MSPEVQQNQWHDEFIQRLTENEQRQDHFNRQHLHWSWQKLFWIFMSGMAIATLLLKFDIIFK